MIVLRYRDRDNRAQELQAPAFIFDAELSLYALDDDGERHFVGELDSDHLNVYGYEWRKLEFHGALEVRHGAARELPYGSGLSVGQVWGEPRIYDRQGAGRTLGNLGAEEILICPFGYRRERKARRLSALAAAI